MVHVIIFLDNQKEHSKSGEHISEADSGHSTLNLYTQMKQTDVDLKELILGESDQQNEMSDVSSKTSLHAQRWCYCAWSCEENRIVCMTH